MNVGKNLQVIRELNNYTQSYVADKLGISQKSYSNLERANNDISLDILLRLSELYQISLTKILELNAETILNNNSQNGGISCINNHNATIYSCEKEMFQQLLNSQNELIQAQQQIIKELQKQNV